MVALAVFKFTGNGLPSINLIIATETKKRLTPLHAKSVFAPSCHNKEIIYLSTK